MPTRFWLMNQLIYPERNSYQLKITVLVFWTKREENFETWKITEKSFYPNVQTARTNIIRNALFYS